MFSSTTWAKEGCRDSRWKKTCSPLAGLPSPRCRAGVYAPLQHREQDQSSLLPPALSQLPTDGQAGTRTHFLGKERISPEDVGGEDAAGWRTLLPTSTSSLFGSDEPVTSFLLLEGNVWGR